MKRVKKLSVFLAILAMGLATLQPLGAERNAAAQGIEAASAGAPWPSSLAAWHYRRPVTVSNGGAAIATPYQVLVTLDSSTFDFSKANTDLSDLRVTASDGTTLLPFWLEQPYSSPPAYVWVKLPSVPAGDTTIYLYFGNSSAATDSNGRSTFDLFDDNWCQFSGANCLGNPVLEKGAAGAWDGTDVGYPSIFEDTSAPDGYRYHMMYTGNNAGTRAKGYASSDNLNTWAKYGSNPVLSGYTWGDTVKIGTTYYMFPATTGGVTYRAVSTDLTTWVRDATKINITNDAGATSGVAILKEGDGITPIIVDGKYWMVYLRTANYGAIYLAYSTDPNLYTWTAYGSPTAIITAAGGWEGTGFQTPSFVRLGSRYYIYMAGNGTTGSIYEIGYALAEAYSGGNPVTPDIAAWTKSPSAVITRGSGWDSGQAIHPMIRRFSNGIYYVFYMGNIAIGYAYSDNPEGPWTKYGQTATIWSIVAGTPTVSGGILTLSPNRGIKTTTTYLYRAMGYRANFGLGSGMEWGGFIDGAAGNRVMIGDLNTDPSNMYLKNYNGSFVNTLLPRVGGVDWHDVYHIYETRWNSGLSIGDIDHGDSTASSTLQVPSVVLPATLYSYSTSTASLLVDWAYVRQYRSPEPTSTVPDLGTRGDDIQETVAVTGSGYYLPFSLIPQADTPGVFNVYVDTQGTLSSVQVVRYPINHPNATACPPPNGIFCLQTGKYWEIHATGTSYSISLTLPWHSTDNSKDKVCYWTGSGQVWDCASSSYDADNITRSGINDLSDWAVGDDVGPTAITLESFTASPTSGWVLPAVLGSGLLGCVLALGVLIHRRRITSQ